VTAEGRRKDGGRTAAQRGRGRLVKDKARLKPAGVALISRHRCEGASAATDSRAEAGVEELAPPVVPASMVDKARPRAWL
jgi:hypothetical protein